MPQLQAKARSGHALEPVAFDPHRINIAVHIRRGDITQAAVSALKAPGNLLGLAHSTSGNKLIQPQSLNVSRWAWLSLLRYVPEDWYHEVRGRPQKVLFS